MIKITIYKDEDLQNAVNNFISALLPHDNYNPVNFSEILNTIFKYVHLDEFEVEYRLLLEALYSLNKLKAIMPTYEPALSRETFQTLLEVSINDAVVKDDYGIKEWLIYEGIDSNLTI